MRPGHPDLSGSSLQTRTQNCVRYVRSTCFWKEWSKCVLDSVRGLSNVMADGQLSEVGHDSTKACKYQRYPRTAKANGNGRDCMQNSVGWHNWIRSMKEWSVTGSRHGMYKAYM